MSIVLQGSTSGSVTLQEPAVAGTTVLTLPAVSGTVLTTTSPKAGNVIQVVNATYNVQTSNSTSTFADTGLTATITPTSSSNKILVMANIGGLYKENNIYIQLRILRNGSTIIDMDRYGAFTSSTATNEVGSSSVDYLDSPATTSAITYKVQFNSANNAAAAFVQTNSSVSTITLMEIAA